MQTSMGASHASFWRSFYLLLPANERMPGFCMLPFIVVPSSRGLAPPGAAAPASSNSAEFADPVSSTAVADPHGKCLIVNIHSLLGGPFPRVMRSLCNGQVRHGGAQRVVLQHGEYLLCHCVYVPEVHPYCGAHYFRHA